MGGGTARARRARRGAYGADLIRDWNVVTSLSGDLAALAPDRVQRERAADRLAEEQGLRAGQGARPRRGARGVRARARRRSSSSSQEPISRARVSVEEYGWTPIGAAGYSFARAGDLVRTTVVHVDAAAGTSVVSGLKDLVVMNTTGSEFWGYPKDAYTTLPETRDRILATSVNAAWRYRPGGGRGVDWDRRSRREGR